MLCHPHGREMCHLFFICIQSRRSPDCHATNALMLKPPGEHMYSVLRTPSPFISESARIVTKPIGALNMVQTCIHHAPFRAIPFPTDPKPVSFPQSGLYKGPSTAMSVTDSLVRNSYPAGFSSRPLYFHRLSLSRLRTRRPAPPVTSPSL